MPRTINPYNFVPLGASGPQRSPYPGLRSLRPEDYSGRIECRLVCLGPLVSVDHRSYEMYQLRDEDGNPATDRNGQAKRPIKLFKFLRNSAGAPIVQGASLKGMVRAVYEAIQDACLVLAATEGLSNKSRSQKIPYTYTAGGYTHDNCNTLDKLCPACRLFGAIGDTFHCQGRILFTDATLSTGNLVTERRFLRELSSPKPHHAATYSTNGRPGGEIAGRKFYYHHKQPPAFSVLEPDCPDRSSAVDEHAPGGTEFSFQAHISDLDARELSGLLLALELEPDLGHKLGMGKAIGLGSARIEVDVEKSKVWRPKDRYRLSASPTTAASAPTWYAKKAKLDRVRHGSLYELLRLDKPDDGEIAYPVGTRYPPDRIDARGRFGGSAMTGRRDPESPEEQVNEAIELPPVVGSDEQAAWLKALFKDEMLLVTADNKEARRPYSAFQAKKSLLVVGKWYVLSGTKSVKPPRGR